MIINYILLLLGGRHPLCGIGVMSRISLTSTPEALSVRIADSRPAPGPLTNTFTFLSPKSYAVFFYSSSASCAAYGVFFLDPLKPILPALAQEIT